LSLFRGFPFISTIIGVLVGPAVFFVVGWLVAKYKKIPIADALGLGDYWLIAMIGAFIGWKMVPVAIILSAVVGLVIALPGAVRAAVLRTESPKIPFGVFLALGGAVTLLVGDRLVSWYGHWALGR
jgi:leader peptidase (prepilin peptidase)/N-methyltransferase